MRLPENFPEDRVHSLFQRGLELHQAGRLDEALEAYQQVLQVSPQHFDALYGLGIVAAQNGHPLQAVEFIDRALGISPDHAEARFNRANLLRSLDRSEEALADYDRAIELNPGFVPAHFNRAMALHALGRAVEALDGYDYCIKLEPGLVEAYLERGNALKDLNRLEEALVSYDDFIRLKPGVPVAHNNRGNVLKDLDRPQEALDEYGQAIALKSDYAVAHYNRGNVLKDLGRSEEALASYDQAIKLEPGDPKAHNNRGIVLRDLRRHDEALDSYRHAIELQPDFASAHYNLSHCALAIGNYALGWAEYEWRWKEARLGNSRRDFSEPLWLGRDGLEGRTILLHGEQGLGDILQFSRYAKLVGTMGAQVILEVPSALLGVLKGLDGIGQLVARGSPLPSFDYHCPLMSLPLAFKTTLETVPAEPRYIASDPGRVAVWRERLGPKVKPRVGLAWSGNPMKGGDRHRSIELATMSSLLCPEIEWFSLHRDTRQGDAEMLSAHPEIHHYGEELNFVETAALIELMDLVISVDTSIAHLAGGMGKTVWILLHHNPDWRWLLDRNDSPWYPSAQLFRQKNRGDWAPVLREVKQALSAARRQVPLSGKA